MPSAPEDLTLPVGGTDAARTVLSGAIRRLLADLPRLARDPALRPVARAVAEAARREPGPVFSALRRPTVGAAARHLRARSDTALARQLAATLAAEVAAAGAELPLLQLGAPAPVCCLGARRVLPAGAATLEGRIWRAESQRVDLGAAPPKDSPYTLIAGGVVLATVDDNPLAMNEAHPDKEGNAIDLGGRPREEWIASLRDAFDRVERYLPMVREEVDLVLSQIVPVGFHERRHLSASYAEAIGTIYLTLHPDPMTMTEALVHELSHNKLNALADAGPLLENAFHPLFSSPVRPDLRPLHGVLLAVHAFLPIEALYRRMKSEGDPLAGAPPFSRRMADVVAKNREGASVLLENARPTALGAPLLDELRRLVAAFDDEGDCGTEGAP